MKRSKVIDKMEEVILDALHTEDGYTPSMWDIAQEVLTELEKMGMRPPNRLVMDESELGCSPQASWTPEDEKD